jgi:hypothetical protein
MKTDGLSSEYIAHVNPIVVVVRRFEVNNRGRLKVKSAYIRRLEKVRILPSVDPYAAGVENGYETPGPLGRNLPRFCP